VLNRHKEPHVQLRFINYPRKVLTPGKFRASVEHVATELMHQFEQNRIVIEFPDEMLMLERSDEMDPGVGAGIAPA
jgi:hypothetical protein